MPETDLEMEGPEKETDLQMIARAQHDLDAGRSRRMKLDWQRAKMTMQSSDPRRAVDFLRSAPPMVMQVHLLAEEATLNRPGVLMWFPKVGKSVREKYGDFLLDIPAKNKAPAAEPTTESPTPSAAAVSTSYGSTKATGRGKRDK